ncbi:tetratricopeptide repeat protein [Streptomyces canus]|uniref:tetratricopeptide repeat protein n=1 Tax=Streptomyces canus TaxID=58343 RepID=UPI002253F1B5|nr:tetratricopeptide repeat protein [Streptomyces canus]MCX5262269.1 tetratricopeptide repeat protein [Streptomyces canus]
MDGSHGAVRRLRLLHALALDSGARYTEAETEFRELIEVNSLADGAQGIDTLAAKHGLGTVLAVTGRLDEAETLLREVTDVRRRVLGDSHPETLMASSNLAGVFLETGRRDEALPLLRAVSSAQEMVLGADHPDAMTSRHNFATAQEDPAAAASQIQSLIATRTHLLGAEHPHTLRSRVNLAIIRHKLGEKHRAEAELREILALQRRVRGDDLREIAETWHEVLDLLRDRGDLSAALAELRAMDAAGIRPLLPSVPGAWLVRSALAQSLIDAGIPEQAEVVLRDLLSTPAGDESWMKQQRFHARNLLAEALEEQKQPEAAVQEWEELLANPEPAADPGRGLAAIRNRLAVALVSLDRPHEAVPHLRRGLTGVEHGSGDHLTLQHNLVRAMWESDDLDGAESEVRGALLRSSSETVPSRGALLLELAGILRDRGNLRDAEKALTEAVNLCRAPQGENHPDTRTAVAALAHVQALRTAPPASEATEPGRP